MEPKIDSIILSGPNGHHAVVSGPINWDSDEISATFGASITQMKANGNLVLAGGQNDHQFTPADARWSVQVSVVDTGTLIPGAANGWATAAVHEDSGYGAYPWEVDNLTIEPPGSTPPPGDVVSATRGKN